MLPEKTCTGCGACACVCPKNCISMVNDAYGFLRPEIDTEVCIKCGLCEKVCPVLKTESKKQSSYPVAYASKSLDDNVRKKSSSGGIFTAVAEYIIENNGIVYGAAFSDNMSVEHIAIKEKSDLDKLRRSKYVQSNLKGCFKKIKEQLENNYTVLFSGTPCQVAGLLSFLQKPYKKLITLDFVCHGVPSPLVWQEYLKFQEKGFASKITDVNFRDKAESWKNYSIRLSFENQKSYSKVFRKDPYMNAFLANISLRSSCYECKCKGINHISDITVADYWGIDKIEPSLDDDRGLSLVLIQSEKGEEILECIKDKITVTQMNVTDVFPYNPCLIKPVEEHNFRQYFFNRLGKKDFSKLVNDCLSPSYITRLHRKLIQSKGGK